MRVSLYRATPAALVDAARFAGECHRNASVWNGIASRALEADFSWRKAAEETGALYASVLARFGMLRAA